MKYLPDIIGFTFLTLIAMSFTNVLWHMTGYKWLTIWYWFAMIGGANV